MFYKIKRALILSTSTIFITFTSSYSFSLSKIAVLPFRNINGDINYDWISQGFSESLTTAFSQMGKFIVVERNQINQILGEQAFQKSGFVNDKSIAEIGKVLGVDKLVIGSYQIFQGNININSRVIDVSTAQVDNGHSITNKRGKLDNIFDLQEEICLLHAKSFENNFTNLTIEDKKMNSMASLTMKSTKSMKAYEYYVKGRNNFILFTQKGYEKAIENYQKALEIDNGYSLALSEMALTYAKYGYLRQQNGQEYQSYFDKGIEFGNKAVASAPDLGASHKGLGVVYLKMGAKELAEKSIRKSIELNPSDVESYFFLWHLTSRDVNSDLVKKIIQMDPNFAPVYNFLGELYENKNELDLAIENYKKATELNENFAYAHSNLANVYLKKNDLNNAIKYYEKSIEADPTFTTPYISLGNIFESKGNFGKALKYYEEAIKSNEYSVHAYNNLGVAYHQIKSFNKAIESYKKAIDINPNFETAYINMALVYENVGSKNDAIEIYKDILNRFPNTQNKAEITNSINRLK